METKNVKDLMLPLSEYAVVTENATLHEARAAYEREFILRKLEENQWNMTRTAQALGLERSHLYRKMKSLGISPTETDD